MLDIGEENDFFGGTLASGDFDGDGRDDLAIGVTVGASASAGAQCYGYTNSCGEDLGGVPDAGAVNVLYGLTAVGLTAVGNQLWWQGSSGVPDDLRPTTGSAR